MTYSAAWQRDDARPHHANDNETKYGMFNPSQRSLGQYFTSNAHWLDQTTSGFIGDGIVVDPFAGGGDLLKHFPKVLGYDIDPALGWTVNDSLIGIPKADGICVTNPPYLAKNAAKRLRLTETYPYFETGFDDLYELGIHQCLNAFTKVVAIVPESFLSTRRFKDRLSFVNIIEPPLFTDTDCPVLVAGWDQQPTPDFRVYKNSTLVGWWKEIVSAIPPASNDNMTFNDPDGGLGLICFDGIRAKSIRFCWGDEVGEVKRTGRSKTRISVPAPVTDHLIDKCNSILDHIRFDTSDMVLSPFKGNTVSGERRRRLDFTLARRIISLALAPADLKLAA